MQMFILDENPILSARYLADTHICVIGREIAMQLSSFAHYNLPFDKALKLPYKPMSINQPLVNQLFDVNVRAWAIKNAEEIFKEFRRRFNRVHASEVKFKEVKRIIAACKELSAIDLYRKFSYIPLKEPKLYCLRLNEAVELYREYYQRKIFSMKKPAKYTNTAVPEWLDIRRD